MGATGAWSVAAAVRLPPAAPQSDNRLIYGIAWFVTCAEEAAGAEGFATCGLPAASCVAKTKALFETACYPCRAAAASA